ncbi:MAG: hypothetical protein QOH57_4282 [Mycobacterium sp.]|nr:hypothetical protein [Mycobacterium sp.]
MGDEMPLHRKLRPAGCSDRRVEKYPKVTFNANVNQWADVMRRVDEIKTGPDKIGVAREVVEPLAVWPEPAGSA